MCFNMRWTHTCILNEGNLLFHQAPSHGVSQYGLDVLENEKQAKLHMHLYEIGHPMGNASSQFKNFICKQ